MSEKAELLPADRVARLAERIERHAASRDLRPGDPYLTAAEAAGVFGVGRTTAHRAMKRLADRGVLVRRPRAGTFVGPNIRTSSDTHMRRIHMIGTETHLLREHRLNEAFLRGLRSSLPGVAVELNFRSGQDHVDVQRIAREAMADPHPEGMVVFLSSRMERELLNASDAAAVVYGSVEPDLDRLCWIDRDQKQIGHLLTQHLVDGGHRQIAVLMRDTWALGENLLLDGIGDVLGEAGLPANRLTVRSCPASDSATTAAVRELFRGKSPPTGMICRAQLQAELATQVLAELGLEGAVSIVLCDPDSSEQEQSYTSTVPVDLEDEIGARISGMLAALSRGEHPDPGHYVIPVMLNEASK